MSLEDRSQLRRERQKRWRQSSRGRSKLRARYRERVRFLDRLKRERGCQACGERDPRTLDFYPRDSEKIKFAPNLVNITRSLKDWRRVVQRCDVLCQNCSRKQKRPARSRSPVKGQRPSQIGRRLTVNGCPRPDFEQNSTEGYHPTCETCETEFKPLNRPELRTRKRFCSARCRLLSWATRELLKAYQEGRADGLYDMISKLGGKLGP